MLEERDLQAIKSLLQDNNKIIKKDTKESITESEKMLLEEINKFYDTYSIP